MNTVSRRQALGCVPAAAICTALSGSANSAHGAEKEAGEDFVIGPFRIDGWFLKTQRRAKLGGPGEPLSTPNPNDLAKVLSGCRVYLFDRRTGADPKKAQFVTGAGYPKVVLEGAFCGEWKDGKKSFTVAVAKVTTSDERINSIKGVAFHGMDLTVTIHLWGTEGEDTAHVVYHFTSDSPVEYDITGAVRTE